MTARKLLLALTLFFSMTCAASAQEVPELLHSCVRDLPPPKPGAQRIRISSGVLAGTVASVPDITVSDDAKKVLKQLQHLALQVSINVEGEVVCYKLLANPHEDLSESNAQLVKGELDEAVKNWRFRPYLLNGNPISSESMVPLELKKNTLKVFKR